MRIRREKKREADAHAAGRVDAREHHVHACMRALWVGRRESIPSDHNGRLNPSGVV